MNEPNLTREQKAEHGTQELAALRRMVLTWKESYSRLIDGDVGGDVLGEDLQEEIETIVLPYVRRIFETRHIGRDQVTEFLEFCHQQVNELRNATIEEG